MELWQWRCGKQLIGRGRHVSDAGTRSTEGVGKWWWQNWSPQAANPFFNLLTAASGPPAHALFCRQSKPGVTWEHHTSTRHLHCRKRALQSYTMGLDKIWTSFLIRSIAQPPSDGIYQRYFECQLLSSYILSSIYTDLTFQVVPQDSCDSVQ